MLKNKIKNIVEWNVFGVCTSIGQKMGIATAKIRMYFLYATLATFGSPIIIYMILAFFKNLKRDFISARRDPLRYL